MDVYYVRVGLQDIIYFSNSAPKDNGSHGWTMTEFNLEKESDDYSQSFNLCVTGQGSINLVSASWYQHSTVGP